jgi:hypothetical protein
LRRPSSSPRSFSSSVISAHCAVLSCAVLALRCGPGAPTMLTSAHGRRHVRARGRPGPDQALGPAVCPAPARRVSAAFLYLQRSRALTQLTPRLGSSRSARTSTCTSSASPSASSHTCSGAFAALSDQSICAALTRCRSGTQDVDTARIATMLGTAAAARARCRRVDHAPLRLQACWAPPSPPECSRRPSSAATRSGASCCLRRSVSSS